MHKIVCNNCNGKWYIDKTDIDNMQCCLYCQKPIRQKKELTTFDSLDKVIFNAITCLGDNALSNPRQLSGYLMDTAPEFKKELRILIRALSDDYYLIIKEAFSADLGTAETLMTKLRTLLIEDDGLSESWADIIRDSYLGAVKLSKGIGLEDELLVSIEDYEPPAAIPVLKTTTYPAPPAPKPTTKPSTQTPNMQAPAQQKKPPTPVQQPSEDNYRCTICGYRAASISADQKCPVCKAQRWESTKKSPQPVHQAAEDNYRCAICGYRAVTISADQKCPICKAQRWENTKQSPQPATPSNQSAPQTPPPQKQDPPEITPKILRKMEEAELLLAGNSSLKKEEYVEAAAYYRAAAQRGNATAQYELGRLYHFGLGVGKDAELADEALCAAANNGYIPAYILLGKIRYDAKKYSSAWKWFYKAAEKKDPTALYYAFLFYKNGHHVTRNEKNANRYLEMALQQSSPDAHLYVAKEAHAKGDFAAALPHFQSAAGREVAEAQYYLGKYYSAGHAVKADIFTAAYWYKRAADQGHTKAKSSLENCVKSMSATQKIRWKFLQNQP